MCQSYWGLTWYPLYILVNPLQDSWLSCFTEAMRLHHNGSTCHIEQCGSYLVLSSYWLMHLQSSVTNELNDSGSDMSDHSKYH